MKTTPYLRTLTQEEIKKLPNGFNPHPLLENRALVLESKLKVLSDDIKRNGMQRPIVIHNSVFYVDEEDGTEHREFVIVEGYNRYVASGHAGINKNRLPFVELIGTDEEVIGWVKRERDVRIHDDTKTRVIKAIEITIPELLEKKKGGEWKKHSLYKKNMKGIDDLAAAIEGVSRGNIHKGMDIREHNKEVYHAMRSTDLTLEAAYKFLNPQTWTDKWLEQVQDMLKSNMHPSLKAIRRLIQTELALRKERAAAPKKRSISMSIKKVNLEDCDIDAEIIIKVNRRPNETSKNFNKRVQRIVEKQKETALLLGHNQIRIITGEVGKGLLDEALKNIVIESEKCEEPIQTVIVKAPNDFNEDEIKNFKKFTRLKPMKNRSKFVMKVRRRK